METKDLYLIKHDNSYLLKEDKKFLLCLQTEDVNFLFPDGIDSAACGIVEESENLTWALKTAEAKEKVTANGYVWIEKSELFNQSLRPGDKMFLAQLLNGVRNVNLYTRYKGDKLTTAYDKRKVNPVKAFFKHLHTVNHHRRLVRSGCFKVGLYKQGLIHDLSKYSPTEFWVGVKYYQGMRSPNVAERMVTGYSMAWMHHKGRNKHHAEYWTDYSLETGNTLEYMEMPKKYLVESVMDRIAACKVYRGKNYNDSAALDYLTTRDSEALMNKKNYNTLVFLFTMLSEKGEKETFRYIKEEFLK